MFIKAGLSLPITSPLELSAIMSFSGKNVTIEFRGPTKDSIPRFELNKNIGPSVEVEGDQNTRNDLIGLGVDVSPDRITLIATEFGKRNEGSFDGPVINYNINTIPSISDFQFIRNDFGLSREDVHLEEGKIFINAEGVDQRDTERVIIKLLFRTPDEEPSGEPPVQQPDSLSREQIEEIALLYEAALGRFPDIPGLNFWIDERTNGLSPEGMARGFLRSPEFRSKIGDPETLGNRELVESLFRNVLKRDGNATGIDFWTSQLTQSDFTKADALIAFANSPENRRLSSEVEDLVPRNGSWVFDPDPQLPENVSGTPEGEFLRGIGGDDTIRAFGGDDVLWGGAGNDRLNGGGGTDVAFYQFPRSRFDANGEPTSFTLSGPAGTDTLVGMETLRFADGDVAVGNVLADGEVLSADYAVTAERFAVSRDYEARIDMQYGVDARLADWETVSDRYQAEGGAFLREAGLVPKGEDGIHGGAVMSGGERFWSGERHYSVTWGNVSSSFLSHDTVTHDGVPLHLGSWYKDKHILAKLPEDYIADSGDSITGTPDPDNLIGGAGSDTIEALGGDDIVTATAGNDHIYGGEGADTAFYSGNQSSHTLTLGPGTTTLTDRRDDGNGTDTLIDMEFLDFDPGSLI